MTLFNNKSLTKLQDPALLIQVAKAVHEQALEFVAQDEIPKHYLDAEVYEPATQKTTPDGRAYYEISRYGDGFGGSLFILDDKMLLLTSNHETASIEAIDGDRDSYLTPILVGLPSEWDFIVEMLKNDDRFELNPPVGVFWYTDGEWHITDHYDAIKDAPQGDRYYDYHFGFDTVDETDLSYLFAHGGETAVNQATVVAHFNEWKF